ncbi:MAG TPA: glycosyltransferase family 4 protein [Candidatus Paceibacterota bacterium]|nr:glycosyltransferase family 4 protein [Candidatus Paceibacterota bacterium]
MRLCIATPLYPPESGGPATYAKILEERLPGKGIEIMVVKFSVVRRYPKALRHAVYTYLVLRALRQADAVLALDPVSTGLPSALAARLLRKPFFVKVVGDYAWEQGRQRYGVSGALDAFVRERQHSTQVRMLQAVEAWVAKSAHTVIVPSQYLKRIVAAWGVPMECITVIPNGIALGVQGVLPAGFESLPVPRIVTVGRLVPWKGIGGLIDAVADLREEGIETSLVIVGDGPHRQNLEAYAKARLSDGYAFTGELSHEDTLKAIAEGDVFALNTAYEGLSHVLIEALSLGAVIVTTTAGGNGELITDEEEGLLVEHGDRKALPQALKRALTDEPLRRRIGRLAELKAKDFTEDAMIERTVAFFTDSL